jgi:N-methylhydantoinase B
MNSISDISKAFSSISPIDVSIFQSMTHSIAEEMGAALRRTAFSPNIKERRDYSCAIFDGNGQVIAMGDHMPVHLGSMPMSVRAAINAVPLGRGDIAILNDPYCGGTHLPDITMVMAVFTDDSDKPIFYTAARAHHADVGGRYPGSMGPCREIYEEGLRIPPVLLVRGGVTDTSLLRTLLENVRTPHEREGDLRAQIGACRIGERRLHELMHKFTLPLLNSLAKELFDYSERLTRAEIARMPSGVFEAEDFLDDDGSSDKPIRIHVRLSIDAAQGTTTVDFTGTDPQVENSLNAVLSIAYSAVYYVFRCLLPAGAPATAGLMRPVTLIAPEGSVVNARLPAPVAGGNVETSQRIVDVLLHALASVLPERIPAASCGTMTNLTIGGMDPRHHSPFAYYETTAGGTGALPNRDGISGLHMHMTNSLNTPVEALEYAYPFRVVHYGYRRGSGGKGRFRGGDGLIRELQLLTDAQVTLLADRQKIGPYGLQGGENGTPGHISLLHNGQWSSVPGKVSLIASKGDVIRVETPGGGGWGKAQPTT